MTPDLDEYDLDEIELGERAAYLITVEELGALYGLLKDRIWSVVLECYANMAQAIGADNVPEAWRPRIDDDGMWRMP